MAAGEGAADEAAGGACVGAAVGLAGAVAPGCLVTTGAVDAWQEASRKASPTSAVARVERLAVPLLPSILVGAISLTISPRPGFGRRSESPG
jgi:hypothetical protein